MKINNTSADLFVKMGLMSKSIKKTSGGNGLEFAVMMQSLLNASSQKYNQDVKNGVMTTEPGKVLEDLALKFKGDKNYNNTYVNSDIKVEESKNEKPIVSSITELIKNEKNPTKKEIYKAVEKYSKEFSVDPKFVLSIIKAESNFNPKTTSHAGAMGVMQLMPVTAREEGVKNPYDISENIRGGISQISKHLKRYNGNKEMALMAYNAGAGTVQRRGVKSPSDLYKMPGETRNYVPKVMKFYREGKF